MSGRIFVWALPLLLLFSGNSEAHRGNIAYGGHDVGENTGHYVDGLYATGKHLDRVSWDTSCDAANGVDCFWYNNTVMDYGWQYRRSFTWLYPTVRHCPSFQTLQAGECAPSNSCQLPDYSYTADTAPIYGNADDCLFQLASQSSNQDGTIDVVYSATGWAWADHDSWVSPNSGNIGNPVGDLPQASAGYPDPFGGGGGGGSGEQCPLGQRGFISWAYEVAGDSDKSQFCLSTGCRALLPTDSGGSVDAICLGLPGDPDSQCVAEVVLNGQTCTAGGGEGDTDTSSDNAATGGTVVNVDNSGVESRLDTLIAQGEAAAAGGDCDPAITPGCAGGTGTIPSTTGAESFGAATQGFYDGVSAGPWGTALAGSYTTTGAAGDCPTAEFDWVDGTPMVVDFHCTLIEDSKPVIAAAFLFLWTFVSVRTLFSA